MTDDAGYLQLHQVRQELVESLARVPGGTREKAEETVKHLDVATFLDTDGEPDRVKIETFAAQAEMNPQRTVTQMRADRLQGKHHDPRPGTIAEARAARLAQLQGGGRR